VAAELLLQLFLLLLAAARQLPVLFQPYGLEIHALPQAVDAQGVDLYLLTHLVVLSGFVVFVLEAEEGGESVGALGGEAVGLEQVFGVLVHEGDLVFDFHDELSADGLEAAFVHAEEVVAGAGVAAEGLDFECEEQQVGVGTVDFELVQAQYAVLHLQLPRLGVFVLLEVGPGAAPDEIAAVADGLHLRRMPLLRVGLVSIVDLQSLGLGLSQ